jgi:hypothetical protein
MDINARLDGFLVHPLDLFPKNQEFDETTANLDGFKVHPLDSFINHNKNDPYKYLQNNTKTNYDNNNLINNINSTPINQNYEANLYDQYTTTKNEPYLYSNNINYNNTYNSSDNTNKIIKFNKYPVNNSTYYTQAINHNYDYLQANSYNNNILGKYPKYKITNFVENYSKTYDTFPNDSSTNNTSYEIYPSSKIINTGITHDKYTVTANTSDMSYGMPSSFDILNSNSSNDPFSFKSFHNYSKTNRYNYNIFPTSTLTKIKTIITQPKDHYTINPNPNYSKGLSINSYPKKAITNYKGLSSFKSTQDIFKNMLTSTIISPRINTVYRETSFPLRSYTIPKTYKSNRATAILPSKTKIILPKPTNIITSNLKTIIIPKTNQRIVERVRTPILSNAVVSSPNKIYNFSSPKKNVVTIPSIITHTTKPIKSGPKLNQINIIPPRTIDVTGTKIKSFMNFGKSYYKPKDFVGKKNDNLA